jgi:hypothetical protein
MIEIAKNSKNCDETDVSTDSTTDNPTNPTTNMLTNSTTKILKATYVPLDLSSDTPIPVSNSAKNRYIQQLKLQPGEVAAVQKILEQQTLMPKVTGSSTESGTVISDLNFWSLLQQLEGTNLNSQLPHTVFEDINVSDLKTFVNGLLTLRKQMVQRLQQASQITNLSQETNLVNPSSTSGLISAMRLLNIARCNSIKSLIVPPIGMMELERLEMTPVGFERGSLLATIPLAPKERTFVVQKEWSVTSQEFTSIVTDSLDNFSETGVTENTQLAQSTASQVAHNNQLNVTASASGGIGFVSASGSVSSVNQDQNSASVNNSRQQSLQTTRMASSRVRQSHKTTISTTSVAGTSEATTRKLENPSDTDPIRIDYYSIMQKWYVGLYRYGKRLTYDVTIPEPGATLREVYAKLAVLQAQASQPFNFPHSYSDISSDPNSPNYYQKLASQYGTQVPPPPIDPNKFTVGDGKPLNSNGNPSVWSASRQITVPDGYQIDKVFLTISPLVVDTSVPASIGIVGYVDPTCSLEQAFFAANYNLNNFELKGFFNGFTGSVPVICNFGHMDQVSLLFSVWTAPTSTTWGQWQASVYSALYNAAQSTYYSQQQSINNQIQALQNQITNIDTLTLRREENDEIMKGVLRWIIPNFSFISQDAEDAYLDVANAAASLSGQAPVTLTNLYKDAANGVQGQDSIAILDMLCGTNFIGNTFGISTPAINCLIQNEKVVNFINQAIEWENVVYFTYSYFWDEPFCWDFVRQIQHPDKIREAFLRSGSARVVLTVRKGWELAWSYFVLTGTPTLPNQLPQPLPPYLSIAQQIEAYDNTNYPGIPPANPNGGGPIDDDTPQFGTVCTHKLIIGDTIIQVDDSSGFKVGATVIIDNWDAGIDPITGEGPTGQVGIGAQETATITGVTNDPNKPPSITVSFVRFEHKDVPFPVVQASAKGVLIGEWFEYTPTSGTDIAVTRNPQATS